MLRSPAPALPKEWSVTLTGQLVDRANGGSQLPATQAAHAKQLKQAQTEP